jgi:thiosulfate/3-mercaptopyruvate sulfurtransferase
MAAKEIIGEDLLVDAAWIAARRGNETVLIDTRPAADFWQGHLDNARHFDPFPFHHSDTGEPAMREFRGQLGWIFSALGIRGNEIVVFYENDSGMRATRAAWALAYMGHPEVRILDGGLKHAASLSLVTGVTPYAPTDFKGEPRESEIASHGYIRDRLGGLGV